VIDDLRLTLEIGIRFSTEENSYIFSNKSDWLQGNCSGFDWN
jgi:hypothetical protein